MSAVQCLGGAGISKMQPLARNLFARSIRSLGVATPTRWLEQQPESVLCKKLCIDWLGWFGKRRIRVDHLPSEKPDPAE